MTAERIKTGRRTVKLRAKGGHKSGYPVLVNANFARPVEAAPARIHTIDLIGHDLSIGTGMQRLYPVGIGLAASAPVRRAPPPSIVPRLLAHGAARHRRTFGGRIGLVVALRRLVRGLGFFAALVCAALAAADGAYAQGKLEARYSASLAGIPIGKGNWVVDIGDRHYTAAASGITTGLVRVFTGGQGTSVAHGTFAGGESVSSIYASTLKTSKKTDEVKLTVNGGNVKDSKVDPPIDDDPERVPITDEHQHGIMDPMTASLLRTPGTGSALSPLACERTLSIFDGRLRYDLQFAFKRMDKVKAAKGYEGPVVVCAVYFTPIAGYIPSRPAMRYVSKLRDMEIWLAPIAGTRILVPFRAQGPTPIGLGVVEATQFVSAALPKRASANGIKTR